MSGPNAVEHVVLVSEQEHDNANRIAMEYKLNISQKHRLATMAIAQVIDNYIGQSPILFLIKNSHCGAHGLAAVGRVVPANKKEHENVKRIVMEYKLNISQKHRLATTAIVQVINSLSGQSPFDILFQEYSLWSSWSSCSLTCGSGVQRRARKCQENCDDVQSDNLSETRSCNNFNCPGLFKL